MLPPEARHAAKLTHKNIVTLYEYGQANGVRFLALEFVEGIDLYDYIEGKGQLAPEEPRRILVQAVKALDHAYQQGIIHRDIKLSNFLAHPRPGSHARQLTDMGLALNSREEEFSRHLRRQHGRHHRLPIARTGAEHAEADIRSDIYSLGCTFYHMLAGNPPFSEGGLGERILKHLQEEPPDIRQFNPHVSEEIGCCCTVWRKIRKTAIKRRANCCRA